MAFNIAVAIIFVGLLLVLQINFIIYWFGHIIVEIGHDREISSNDPGFAKLINDIGYYLHDAGMFAIMSIAWCIVVLAIFSTFN